MVKARFKQVAERSCIALALSLLLLPGKNSLAQSPADHHAKVELIAEDDSIDPGRQLWVGLRFRMDPGWHIYWVNPGDSGEPPRVQWEMPEGFRAGAIHWPYPVRLGRGSIMDYGYEGQVLLTVPIEAPANLESDTTVEIGATVKWLVCSEICIPEQAHLTFSLPVRKDAPKPALEWRALFQETKSHTPRPAPAGWKVRARSGRDHFVLTVENAALPAQVNFFPLEGGVIENSARQSRVTFDRGFRLSLKKSEQLVKPVSELRGILVTGTGRAYEIVAPVTER